MARTAKAEFSRPDGMRVTARIRTKAARRQVKVMLAAAVDVEALVLPVR